METNPARLAAQKRRPAQAVEAENQRGSASETTALRRSSRNKPAIKQSPSTSESLHHQRIASAGAPPIFETTETPKRTREEDEGPFSQSSPPKKRVRALKPVSRQVGQKSVNEARVEYWTENRIWPAEVQEESMDPSQDRRQQALARKKSLSSLRRKRSNTSFDAETVSTQTPSDQQPREQKSAPYRHPRFENHLRDRGSFMRKHKDGITDKSKELCQKLLRSSQKLPEDTLFDDDLFDDTLDSLKGRNETRVVRDISQLIVPPAEILAIRGNKNLKILRETTNAGWNNAIPFYGPRPQPDYGLGFKQEAFSKEQLQKLKPFIGNEAEDCSYIAATYDMYLPFLTSEVKCGAAGLDIADRQNAHSQTVALQGLVELFRLVGREKELHREINGFSISHSDVDVRIWGHYPVISDEATTFYRHPIGDFNIQNSELDRDRKWTAYTFVRNIYDIWLPEQFKRLCSVIDMLPSDLNFEVSGQVEPRDPAQEQASLHSGLSQQLQDQDLVDEEVILTNQVSIQQATPSMTDQSRSNIAKRKKKFG